MNGWERGPTKPRTYSIFIISLLWGQNLYVVLNLVFAVLCLAGFGNLPGDMVCYHVVLDVTNISYSIILPVVDFILPK